MTIARERLDRSVAEPANARCFLSDHLVPGGGVSSNLAARACAAALVSAALWSSCCCDARAAGLDPAFDVEVDPSAYLLHGYSVHLGVNSGQLRWDLGAYSADMPHWVYGNGAFDASGRGVAVKAQYYFSPHRTHWFVGGGVGSEHESIENRNAGARATRTLIGVGLEAGYKLELGARFYVRPWVGVDYRRQANDIVLGNETYRDARWMPFAAVHLGYNF